MKSSSLVLSDYEWDILKKKKSRYNSHKIQHVKVQYLGFIIYNYLRIHCVCTHHYLIPHFHHPRKKPRTYQQSVPLPVPKPQPLATADRLSAPTDFDCLILQTRRLLNRGDSDAITACLGKPKPEPVNASRLRN